MGLCKCPERKVTNIFCFEHRVNVCEVCMVKGHSRCVVDTYRNWISDSVFSTKCKLCDEELASGETIRLLCFHLVHWSCLDELARNLPPTTAPAGYVCPVCPSNNGSLRPVCLFPALNQLSPIADIIRKKMGEVNWARAGLGLPLLDVELKPVKDSSPQANSSSYHPFRDNFDGGSNDDNDGHHFNTYTPNSLAANRQSGGDNIHYPNATPTNFPLQFSQQQQQQQNSSIVGGHHHHHLMEGDDGASARKSVKFEETPLLIDTQDEEEKKYRRRTAFDSAHRWMSNNLLPSSLMMKWRRRIPPRRRIPLTIITIIILFTIFVIIFLGGSGGSGGGSRFDDDDGEFNIKANPHIQIGDSDKLVYKH